jgi:hypothetical protein
MSRRSSVGSFASVPKGVGFEELVLMFVFVI